jgi:TatD DNase family protein
MFDTHLHTYKEDNFTEIYETAVKAGVHRFLLAGTNYQDCQLYSQLAQNFPGVYFGIGVHPHDAEQFEGIECYEKLLQANTNKVIAISEVGLDYFYERSNREAQKKVFIEFIKLANRSKLPVVIHCREAEADCYDILRQNPPKHGLVLHCFTGSKTWAEKFLELGAYFSIGGVITFKKSENVREMFTAIPNDRFFLETDSPYLSPVPFRGKKNQPAHIPAIAEFVANLRGLSTQEIQTITNQNASKIFGV